MKKPATVATKPPLHWAGVLFALAANLLLPTVADMALGSIGSTLAYVIAPLIAGSLTALYVRQRGAIHALIGGLLTVPLLGLFIFPGLWQLAILAGAFCPLGGALTELVLRRRRPE